MSTQDRSRAAFEVYSKFADLSKDSEGQYKCQLTREFAEGWQEAYEAGAQSQAAKSAVAVPAGPTGLPYGIIDPDYARIFSIARALAWSEGYAIAMQGSFTRDLDLVAIPWTDQACEPEHLMRRIEDAAGLKDNGYPPGQKPHGRLVWTLLLPGFGDPRFVDLSILPRLAAAPTITEGI